MRTIHRYELPIVDFTSLYMPGDAWILEHPISPRNSNFIEIWAVVDPSQELVERKFFIAGTGNPIPDDIHKHGVMQHIGTVSTHDGSLIWHVFELM